MSKLLFLLLCATYKQSADSGYVTVLRYYEPPIKIRILSSDGGNSETTYDELRDILLWSREQRGIK